MRHIRGVARIKEQPGFRVHVSSASPSVTRTPAIISKVLWIAASHSDLFDEVI
jgi:hypothetical protein